MDDRTRIAIEELRADLDYLVYFLNQNGEPIHPRIAKILSKRATLGLDHLATIERRLRGLFPGHK